MSQIIRVKFLSKTKPEDLDGFWRPLLPEGSDQIGKCRFSFDPTCQEYDFLAVYEDLPPLPGQKKILRSEQLACAPENTLLMTTEPSSIRIDGPHYLRQYGHVWTNRHPSLVRHPKQIGETPPLRFFYGLNLGVGAHLSPPKTPPPKHKSLSVMCSNKAMAHTTHMQRLSFVKALKDRLGDDLDWFGRGIQDVDDKAEAMADYRYHIAIENHIESGHFTEKLTDCFVAGCLPFYFGDPAYDRIFPKDAVIPIDIYDLDSAEETIRNSLKNKAYEKRQVSLEMAREITLKQYNTLRAVATKVETLYRPGLLRGGKISGRHAYRKHHPLRAFQDAIFVAGARKKAVAQPLQQQN